VGPQSTGTPAGKEKTDRVAAPAEKHQWHCRFWQFGGSHPEMAGGVGERWGRASPGASETQYLAVARHGESEANVGLGTTRDGLYYSLSGSDPSVPLTGAGVAQATQLARLVARLFPRRRPLARLYHTRFRRVEHTADAIAAALGYPVERVQDERLNKRDYGKFWNLTRQGVKVLHPRQWQLYRREGELQYRPPEGENYHDVFGRADEFIDTELSHFKGNVLVVTHLLPALCFRRRLEALSDQEVVRQYEEMMLPNGHVMLYRRAGPGKSWQPVELCQARGGFSGA
jgi:broad specificity phosphatase PhoE